MLLRNTSPPLNPFSQSNSLTFVINNKGIKKVLEKNIANKYDYSPKISKLKKENYSDKLFNNDISQIIENNPFEKYINLRDITRQQILNKNKKQKHKNGDSSTSKTEYQYKSMVKFQNYSQKSKFSTVSSIQNTRFVSPPQIYESNKKYYKDKDSYLKQQQNNQHLKIHTFIPIISCLNAQNSHLKENNLIQKEGQKIKQISQNLKQLNKIICTKTIVQYFSNKNQINNSEKNFEITYPKSVYDSQDVPQSKNFDPFQSQLLENDSFMSYSSQKQNYQKFKNSSGHKTNNLSGFVNKTSQKNNQNNQNNVFQSFVQQNTNWPQFIVIMNIKYYYKHLKPR